LAHNTVGGPNISPRHCHRAKQARTLGASRFDVIRLATDEYHVSMDGVDMLREADIQACGFGQVTGTAEDVGVLL
jgi:hypothetical protein